MANRDTPLGFRPVQMLDGSQVPTAWFPVDTGNGQNMFIGDAVKAVAAGGVNVDTAAGTNPTQVMGIVMQLSDTNNKNNMIGHPNSAVATKYLPSSTAGWVKIALALPDAIFRAQADGDTVLTASNINNSADYDTTTGDTTTAKSRMEIDASTASTGAGQLIIIGKVDEPGNDWGLANVDLLVRFSESFFNSAAAGV